MTIPEIIERLEKAERFDRRLDDAIHDAFRDGTALAPHYTVSLDAAVKLCERVLPDYHWTVYSKCHEHGPRAVLVSPEFRKQFGENGKTPVLALLITALSALKAERGQ